MYSYYANYANPQGNQIQKYYIIDERTNKYINNNIKNKIITIIGSISTVSFIYNSLKIQLSIPYQHNNMISMISKLLSHGSLFKIYTPRYYFKTFSRDQPIRNLRKPYGDRDRDDRGDRGDRGNRGDRGDRGDRGNRDRRDNRGVDRIVARRIFESDLQVKEHLQSFKKAHLQKNQAIDKINQYFKAQKFNTSYLRTYNEAKFNSWDSNDKFFSVDDIPFNYKPSNMVSNISKRPIKKYQELYQDKIDEQQLKNKMSVLAHNFFSDLVEKKRQCKMEPNFQRQVHTVICNLSQNGYKFNLIEQTYKDIQVRISDVQFFKGVKVNRNDNYSKDSYNVVTNQSTQNNFTEYLLWKKLNERYPELQEVYMRNIIIRYQVFVKLPLYIDISHQQKIVQSGKCEHQFVFEMDLIHPPKFAQFFLSRQDYIKSYRVSMDNLTVTNVDGKNPFYSLVWSENEKKNVLINKLI